MTFFARFRKNTRNTNPPTTTRTRAYVRNAYTNTTPTDDDDIGFTDASNLFGVASPTSQYYNGGYNSTPDDTSNTTQPDTTQQQTDSCAPADRFTPDSTPDAYCAPDPTPSPTPSYSAPDPTPAPSYDSTPSYSPSYDSSPSPSYDSGSSSSSYDSGSSSSFDSGSSW